MSEPMTDERLNEIRYLHFRMRSEQKADTQSPPDKVPMDAIGDCLDEIDRLMAEVERLEEKIEYTDSIALERGEH